jgi:hypothetical protein
MSKATKFGRKTQEILGVNLEGYMRLQCSNMDNFNFGPSFIANFFTPCLLKIKPSFYFFGTLENH